MNREEKMEDELLKWDVYEINTHGSPITGVMFRGRIRKLALENNRNVLVENAQLEENCVRYAVLHGEDPKYINDYIHSIMADATIDRILEDTPNPVLSKIKVNIESRYTL